MAVLASGGLDSAILLGRMLREYDTVHPLYVREGLYWEPDELAHLRRFLEALGSKRLSGLSVLKLPVDDVLPDHWSRTGEGVPGDDTTDAAVYLPGRNVLILAKSILWCHLRGVPALAMGTLGSNPFPDATPDFFDDFPAAVNRGIGGAVRVLRPFSGLHKDEVMALGRRLDLPLGLTFSCIRPVGGSHCGRCNKCAERRAAFADAGMVDLTHYAQNP